MQEGRALLGEVLDWRALLGEELDWRALLREEQAGRALLPRQGGSVAHSQRAGNTWVCNSTCNSHCTWDCACTFMVTAPTLYLHSDCTSKCPLQVQGPGPGQGRAPPGRLVGQVLLEKRDAVHAIFNT